MKKVPILTVLLLCAVISLTGCGGYTIDSRPNVSNPQGSNNTAANAADNTAAGNTTPPSSNQSGSGTGSASAAQPASPSNGSIDTKLVGHWTHTVYYYNPSYYSRQWYLYLNEDGTFLCFMITTAEYSYKGNYSVADGKLYFTNVVFTNDKMTKDQSDSWVDYTFGSDSNGKERLEVTNSGNSFTGSSWWSREQ